MFGWRKRIGYIAPTVIEVVAYEFYRFAPDGIGITGVTCSIDDWRPEEFEKGLAQVAAAATYLGSRGVDFIIHGGGPLVVARGPHFEDAIVRDVEAGSELSDALQRRAEALSGQRPPLEDAHEPQPAGGQEPAAEKEELR